MIELLVALGVLALAMGSILSIFVTGSRFGARAQARIEAGRAARAVFDLADRGAGSPVTWGRDGNGGINAGTIDNLNSSGQDIVTSPLPMVWEASINLVTPSTYGVELYLLQVRTYFDEDESGDPTSDDRLIDSYCAVLSDR